MEPLPLAELARRTGLPEAELSILRERLEAEPAVVVAYLFGSRATGLHRLHSDLDIALITREESDDHSPRTRLASDLEHHLRRPVDVVPVRGAGPDLAWPVHRDGVLILNRDESARVETHWSAWREYADTEYLRRLRDEALQAWRQGRR